MLTYSVVCRWTEAKDHWASNTLDFETPRKQTLGFKINTHNPESEDLFISRAVHAYQSIRQHMSAYVSICQHTSECLFISRARRMQGEYGTSLSSRSLRPHTLVA